MVLVQPLLYLLPSLLAAGTAAVAAPHQAVGPSTVLRNVRRANGTPDHAFSQDTSSCSGESRAAELAVLCPGSVRPGHRIEIQTDALTGSLFHLLLSCPLISSLSILLCSLLAGYNVTSVKETANGGIQAHLKLIGDACNAFGYDYEELIVRYRPLLRLRSTALR